MSWISLIGRWTPSDRIDEQTMHSSKWTGVSLKKRRDRAGNVRLARKSENHLAGRVAELMLVREIVDFELVDQEPDLAATTWLAYGYMTAYEKTELFCMDYIRQYKLIHAKYLDYHGAEAKQPLDPVLAVNDNREFSSLWKARQHADALGIPYPIFIRAAMDTAVQWNKFNQVPRPNQLLGDKQITAVIEEWERVKDTLVPFDMDWDARFRAPEHRTDPPRLAAVQALVKRLRSRPHSIAFNLAGHLGEGGTLSEDEARTFFEGETVDEALTLSKGRPSGLNGPYPKYMPSCMGMKPTAAPASCSACSFAAGCARVRAKVDELTIKQHGTPDPKAAAKTAGARERQRKSRARKRGAAGG